jgi:hypothetical protein
LSPQAEIRPCESAKPYEEIDGIDEDDKDAEEDDEEDDEEGGFDLANKELPCATILSGTHPEHDENLTWQADGSTIVLPYSRSAVLEALATDETETADAASVVDEEEVAELEVSEFFCLND